MDDLTLPIGSPPFGTEHFFIGYLRQTLRFDGQITPVEWEQALVAADAFQREQKIDKQE